MCVICAFCRKALQRRLSSCCAHTGAYASSHQVHPSGFVVQGFAGFCRTTKEDEDADRQFEKSVREHARLLRHDDGGPIQDQDAHTGDRQQHKQQHHQLADDGRLRAGSDESVRTQERGRGLALLDTGDLADAMADAADTPGGSMENGGSWALPRSSPQVDFCLHF